MLNKEKFLSLRSRVMSQYVPQWDATFYLRVMTAEERLDWVKLVDALPENEKTIVPNLALLARCLCDDSRQRLFDDSQADLDSLRVIDAPIADQLGKLAMRMNGLNEEGREEIKKNWPAAEAIAFSSSSLDI